MAARPGIPLDTTSVSTVVIAGEQLLLVRDPAGFWTHLVTRVEADEVASTAARRSVASQGLLDVALYAAEYLEQYFDLASERIVLCPAFVALVSAPPPTGVGRWCSLAESLELAPFPNQHALYRHVFDHFVTASPPTWLRVRPTGEKP
ncbi:MAG: DNA mismatch repair protein MutT [Pseudomonadota bacterium]